MHGDNHFDVGAARVLAACAMVEERHRLAKCNVDRHKVRVDIAIRPARAEDTEALAALGRQTYIETFVEDFAIPYPADDLAAYLDASWDLSTIRRRLADPGQSWWVAERDGVIVGFAAVGSTTLPHPEARPTHAELKHLYVAKTAQRLGLGKRLLALALDWMTAHTDGPLWLGVWSGNVKAQTLYAAYGFEKAGEYKYPVGSWFDDEFIMRRR